MGERRVDLLGPIRIIHEHLTKALCEEVFEERRITERRRVWTCNASMARRRSARRFWSVGDRDATSPIAS